MMHDFKGKPFNTFINTVHRQRFILPLKIIEGIYHIYFDQSE